MIRTTDEDKFSLATDPRPWQRWPARMGGPGFYGSVRTYVQILGELKRPWYEGDNQTNPTP